VIALASSTRPVAGRPCGIRESRALTVLDAGNGFCAMCGLMESRVKIAMNQFVTEDFSTLVVL
jgi:hypothetical protein